MVQRTKQPVLWIILSAVLLLISTPVTSLAADNDKNLSSGDVNKFEITRIKLKNAIDNYKNGDLEATRRDLEQAIEWLNQASLSSQTEKAREESRQLAIQIDQFRIKLTQPTDNNEANLIGFWHKSTALIEREIDQLIHGYIEHATAGKTLKYLLDAKMDLYSARHDLFVSHDMEDSVDDLESSLEYLDKANQVAIKSIQKKIVDLSKKIQLLKAQVKRSQDAWKQNDEVVLIGQAKERLAAAKAKATPAIKSRITLIEADIQALLTDVERNNIKNSYDSAMAALVNIINEL